MAERPRWLGLRLGVRLLAPRSRGERSAVIVLVAGSAVVMVAVTVVVGLLQALSSRAEVVESRAPSFVSSHDNRAPFARVRVLDTGEVQATIIELGPRSDGVQPPPGVGSWPGPGEVWLSPAAAAQRTRDPYLDSLVRGRTVGRIGRAGLRDPDDVVVVMGLSAAHLSGEVGVARVTGFGLPGHGGGEVETSEELTARSLRYLWMVGLATIGIGAVGLMASVARVADAARKQRLAALHLLGAPLGAVRAVASINAVAWSVVGILAGLVLAWPASVGLSRLGLFGVSWWPSHSFNVRVVVLSAAGVAAIAAWGGRGSVAHDSWSTRRRLIERPLSTARLAPLLAGALLLGGVLVSQARHRQEDVGTPPRLAVLLGVAVAICCCGVVLAAPVLTRALARLVGRRSSTSVRVAAARVDHHVRETSRMGLAPLLLVLVCGGVLGAGAGISWQSSANSSGDRIMELPAVDDLGRPLAPGALRAALAADGVSRAEVLRQAGAVDPFTTVGDRQRSDLSYEFVVRPEDASEAAAAVQRAWPDAPPLYGDRDVSAERGAALMSGTLLVCFALTALMILLALAVGVASLQQGRRASDATLLAVGMSSRRLAAVRGYEVALAALPGPTLAALVALPLGVAVMHLDHTNVPLPDTFALVPVLTIVIVLGLAGIAAALAPRQGDEARRPE